MRVSLRWCALGMLVLALATLAAADRLGVRINHTPSIPVGLWRLSPGAAVARGDIVSVCPAPSAADSARGYSCGWLFRYEPIFKPVAAVEGDIVEVTENGIRVNGVHLPNSGIPADVRARDTTPGATPLPAFPTGTYPVGPGQVWLVSSYSDRSYDSRYFGPIPVGYIQGKLALLWALNK